jgi:hypothetical protein
MTLATGEKTAARLRIAAFAVYRVCREGQLGQLRVGPRGAVRIQEEALADYVTRSAQGQPRSGPLIVWHHSGFALAADVAAGEAILVGQGDAFAAGVEEDNVTGGEDLGGLLVGDAGDAVGKPVVEEVHGLGPEHVGAGDLDDDGLAAERFGDELLVAGVAAVEQDAVE